jgi:hypothetical protein
VVGALTSCSTKEAVVAAPVAAKINVAIIISEKWFFITSSYNMRYIRH